MLKINRRWRVVQLELGEDIEVRIAEAARNRGVSVDHYVRESMLFQLPQTIDEVTLARRRKAAASLSTFAKDRNISLPPGVTIDDLIAEARR